MIALNSLKPCGFGNQLFQYAFIRTIARKLGVKFYFPPWRGDRVFHLYDWEERAEQPVDLNRTYREPAEDCGFHEEATRITDGTEIWGFFQSERHFPEQNCIRKWFTFVAEITKVRAKYAHIDFSHSVSLSLRIGDDYNSLRYRYPLYPLKFYREALKLVRHKESILVFSDHPERARRYFRDLKEPRIHFIEGNRDVEDMFLLTQCHDNIITNSSFAWWGAWLNAHSDKVVVIPREWFRTGGDCVASGIVCKNWTAIRALNPIYEHNLIWLLRQKTPHLALLDRK